MREYEITWVSRRDGRQAAHDRIDALCGRNPDGTPWRIALSDAIAGLERGEWRFYVSYAGRPAWLEVATSREGMKYLKTEHDYDQPTLLLSLPECPRQET